MHKIAILLNHDHYYDDNGIMKIVDSITDWQEVSDDDFKLLTRYAYQKGFYVLEQPVDSEAFIFKTVEEFKQLMIKDQAKKEKEKADEIARREAAAAKRLAKTADKRRQQFEKLKAEFEQNS